MHRSHEIPWTAHLNTESGSRVLATIRPRTHPPLIARLGHGDGGAERTTTSLSLSVVHQGITSFRFNCDRYIQLQHGVLT